MQFLQLHKSWTVGTNCFEWVCGLWIQAGCGCSLKLQWDCDRVCIPLEKALSNDFQWALINPDTASASGSWTISLQIHGRTIMRFQIFQHRIALKDEGVMKTPDTNVFISTDCLVEKLTFNHRSLNWISELLLSSIMKYTYSRCCENSMITVGCLVDYFYEWPIMSSNLVLQKVAPHTFHGCRHDLPPVRVLQSNDLYNIPIPQ